MPDDYDDEDDDEYTQPEPEPKPEPEKFIGLLIDDADDEILERVEDFTRQGVFYKLRQEDKRYSMDTHFVVFKDGSDDEPDTYEEDDHEYICKENIDSPEEEENSEPERKVIGTQTVYYIDKNGYHQARAEPIYAHKIPTPASWNEEKLSPGAAIALTAVAAPIIIGYGLYKLFGGKD